MEASTSTLAVAAEPADSWNVSLNVKSLIASIALIGVVSVQADELRLASGRAVPIFGEALTLPDLDPDRLAKRRALSAVTSGFRVDISRREEVRKFYNSVYAASVGSDAGWTGSIGACQSGTTTLRFKEDVIRRVNYFRAMAGLPAGIVLEDAFNGKAQEAALMMSSQRQLSHFPSAGWACYTPEGYEAAGKSNLALGTYGPDAIDGYMEDHGAGNEVAGHRRWLLYPQTERMGTGDVPGGGNYLAANATWIQDGSFGTGRPSTRETFVAWPPPGYVPYTQVYTRWSFGHPEADFVGATVSVTSNGVPVAVQLEPLLPPGQNVGEPTVVWHAAGADPQEPTVFTRPGNDVEYAVTVRGVKIKGASTDFSYRVLAFDPEVPGPDAVLPEIQGSVQVPVGAPTTYTFNPVPNAEGYEWRQATREAGSWFDGAESNLAGFVSDTSAGYEVVVRSPVASGSFAFHLVHPGLTDDQLLVHRPTYLVGPSSELRFKSRLGWASGLQRASVQISVDQGVSWSELYGQSGTGNAGETRFVARTVSLGAYVGRMVQFRFGYLYKYSPPGSYFPQTSEGVGWTLDDIEFREMDRLGEAGEPTRISSTTFAFTPPKAGAYVLQTRALAFGGYAQEWGPGFRVNASGSAPPIVAWAAGTPKVSGGRVVLEFQVTGGTAPGRFELLRADGGSWAWNPVTGAVLETIQAGRAYRFTVDAGPGTSAFYRVRGL